MEMKPFLDIGIEAALKGGEIIRENFGKFDIKKADEKAKNDFVTFVDRMSEEIIKQTIRKKFPEHSFLAEESGVEEREGEYEWIIDPLDGTHNFIRAFPMVAISIALRKGKVPLIGVVHDPLRRNVFWAMRGEGAFLDGERIHVSSQKKLEGAFIATGFPFRAKNVLKNYLRVFEEIFLKSAGMRRGGSAALDLAYVACGIFDGFFEYGLSIWDIAAGSILVEEAGGTVSGFGEEDYLLTGNIVAASSVELQREVLHIIANHFK